jgi:hypothetical protein
MSYINNSFLKSLLISLCLLSLFIACKQPSKESSPASKDTESNTNASQAQNSENQKMAFKLIPETGLQRIYSIKYAVTIETKSSEPDRDAYLRDRYTETLEVDARLEIKVISSQTNGNWKLSFHIRALNFKENGKSVENNNPMLTEASFIITMNKDGELLNISENQQAGLTQRAFYSYQNPLLMLPWILLPRKPVGIGETWSNEFASAIPDPMPHMRPEIKLKGNGIVKNVNANKADIELGFDSELKMASSKPQPRMWLGKGTMIAVYDLDQAQFISNKIKLTRETIGFAFTDSEKDIKNIFMESLQVDLIKK